MKSLTNVLFIYFFNSLIISFAARKDHFGEKEKYDAEKIVKDR